MQSQRDTKKIAKNTTFLYIRMLLIMIVQFFTVRITLQILGIEDYGIYNVVCGVTNVFTFLTLTMTSAAQRFFAFDLGRSDTEQLKKTLDTALLIFAILGVIVVLALQLVGAWFVDTQLVIPEPRHDAALTAFLLTNILLFVTIMTIPINSLIIAHEDMNVFAYVSIFDAFLKCVIVYLLMVITFDKLITYAFLLLMAACLPLLMYWGYAIKHYEECDFKIQLDSSIGKRLMPYMSWNLLGGISWMLCTQGLSILVNLFFGPVANAAKAIADKINTSVTGFSNNFIIASQPQIVKTYAAGQMEDMHKVIFFSSNLALFLMYIIAVPIIFNTKALLGLWLDEVPDTAVEMTQLILVFAHLGALENPINHAIRATGNIKAYQWKLSCVTFFVVPVAYIFFVIGLPPYWGYISLIVVYSGAFLYRLTFLKKQIGISYHKYFNNIVIKQAKCLLCLLFVVAIIAMIPTQNNIIAICVFMAQVLSVCVVVYMVGFNTYERNKIRTFIIAKLSRR